jgi:hypothetical protein
MEGGCDGMVLRCGAGGTADITTALALPGLRAKSKQAPGALGARSQKGRCFAPAPKTKTPRGKKQAPSGRAVKIACCLPPRHPPLAQSSKRANLAKDEGVLINIGTGRQGASCTKHLGGQGAELRSWRWNNTTAICINTPFVDASLAHGDFLLSMGAVWGLFGYLRP